MKDLRPLLQDEELTEAERRALVAGRGMEPPPEFAGASWAGLVSALGEASGPPGDGGASAGGSGASASASAPGGTSAAASLLGKVAALSIAKAVGIGVALGTLVTTSLVVLSPLSSPAQSSSAPGREQAPIVEGRPPVTDAPRGARDEAPRSVARAPSFAEPVVAAAPEPAATPEHAAAAPSAGGAVPEGASEGTVSRGLDGREVARDGVRDAPTPSIAESTAAPSVASFVAPGEAPPASEVAPRPSAAPPTVQEEARLVGRAREALRGGDPALALQRLEEIRLRFPGGVVRQEREALTIEALVRLGRHDDAARRAAAFVREFPASPYVARVMDLVPVP